MSEPIEQPAEPHPITGKVYKSPGYDPMKWKAEYAANPDKYKQMAKEYYHRNKAKKKAQNKAWRLRNPNKVYKYDQTSWPAYKKIKSSFFLKRSNTNEMAIGLMRIYYKQRGRCSMTGVKLGRDCHLDHIVPRSKGGSNDLDNLQFLAPSVNMAKSNLSCDEFVELCRRVVAHADSKSGKPKG